MSDEEIIDMKIDFLKVLTLSNTLCNSMVLENVRIFA